MKKTVLFISVITLFFLACGSIATTDTAIEYNDDMIAIQSDVDQALVDLLDAIDTYDEATMEDAKDDALSICKEAKGKVEDMDDFDGNDDFKKEMLTLIDMYQDIVENEISDVIFYTINADDLSDGEWDEYYELYDSALEKYDTTFEDFHSYQKEFAEEWDFILE